MSDTSYIEIGSAFFKAIETRNSFNPEDDLQRLKQVIDKIIQRNRKPYKPDIKPDDNLDNMLKELKKITAGDDGF
jgi:hypothetical protein